MRTVQSGSFEGICQSGGYFKTAGRRSDPIRQFEIRGIYQERGVYCTRSFFEGGDLCPEIRNRQLLSGAGGTMADKEICMR